MDQKSCFLKRKEEKPIGKKLKFENDGSFLEQFKLMQKQQQSQANVDKEKNVHKCKTEDSIYELARELAEKVCKEGVQAEMMARIKGRNNPDYQFLFDSLSPVAIFYQNHLESLKKNFEQSSSKKVERPQKRRWDNSNPSPSKDTVSQTSSVQAPDNFMSEFEKAKALVRAKAAAIKGGGTISDIKVVNEEEERKQKEIEEQKMMNEIYLKVIQQQMAAANETARQRKKSLDKPRYEYDSDEDVDGGTWEHKKRQQEMQKTAARALELTENSQGKHHLADFLPPDELQKFLEKVQAVKDGREVDFSDYAKYKIGEDNIGFKMLTKAGWTEGTGLGAKGEGITKPINKGKTSFDQAGLGTEKVAEVKKEDDDFEVYRKRMMLAYKFRPNPLNNPRRPYYS